MRRKEVVATPSDGPNMAEDARAVRLEESLKIKIGEAKNLPPRSHGAVNRDTFCVLSLDQEEIFRTSTVEGTLNPFYGQEFQFDVPRGFRYLSIYVYDRDRQYKPDKVLGKVAIRREDLKKYETDHWFALRPVDDDSEVQGKAHIEILLNNNGEPKKSPSTEDDKTLTNLFERASQKEEDEYSSKSVDRKTKNKIFIKNSGECPKENKIFGLYSSTSSKKLFTYTSLDDKNQLNLCRSESLKAGHVSLDYQCRGSSEASNLKGINTSLSSPSCHKLYKSVENRHFIATPEQLTGSSCADSNYLSSELSPVEKSRYTVHYSKPVCQRNKLSIKVLECSELSSKNGQCDPHAQVTVFYESGKSVTKKTKVRKKTVNPEFDECFTFDLFLDSTSIKDNSNVNPYGVCLNSMIVNHGDSIYEISVSLWNDTVFLGEVRIPAHTQEQRENFNNSAWYFLGCRQEHQTSNNQQGSNIDSSPQGPTTLGTQFSTPASLGSLRLVLHHMLDFILPSSDYEDLQALLLQPPPYKPITSSAVYILGEIFSSKLFIAQPLVKLFMHADLLVPVIKALADAELSTLTDPTTIFRGNTLVSKMMDEAMRLTGSSYLQQTLRGVIDLVLSEKKPCEIDKTRIKEPNTVDANLANLKDYVEKTFNSITQSYIHCPAIMCRLFDALRQCAVQKFPKENGVQYSVVCGFIFLRFFAPAILGPKLFDLTTEKVDSQIIRTLTLISKTIQTLGNLVSSRSPQQHCKEEYMTALYEHFSTETYVKSIKRFLEIISSSKESQKNIQDAPVLLKEGTMIKSAKQFSNKRTFMRLMRKSSKKRYFQLTSCELSYSSARGKKAICSIPLAEIDFITELQMNNMNPQMINTILIGYRSRLLYLQASNCVEKKEWLDLLGKLCEGHRAEPKLYHPSSYIHGRWDCCLALKEDAPGCATVVAQSPPMEIHLRLDPLRDLQRIHCVLYKNITGIEDILKKLKQGDTYLTPDGPPIDDPKSCYETLEKLKIITYALETKHHTYQRSLNRETRYGSKQAPIGDDNYLQLASHNMGFNAMKHSQSINEPGFSHIYGSNMQNYRTVKSISAPSQKPVSQFSSLGQQSTHRMSPILYSDVIQSLTANINLLDKKPTDKITHFGDSLPVSSLGMDRKLLLKSEEKSLDLSTDISDNEYLKMLPVKNDTNISEPFIMACTSNKVPVVDTKCDISLFSVGGFEFEPHLIIKPNLPTEKNTKQNTKENCVVQSCQEYDLLADFSSNLKSKATLSIEPNNESSDVPPAIPPRNHHPVTPSCTRHKKPQILDSTNRSLQLRNSDYEHKSMEQYQLKVTKLPADSVKPDKHVDCETVHLDKCSVNSSVGSDLTRSDFLTTQLFIASSDSEVQENSSPKLTTDIDNFSFFFQSSCDDQRLDCIRMCDDIIISGAKSENSSPEHELNENVHSDIVQRSEISKKENKGDGGYFSRKSLHRKSNSMKLRCPDKKNSNTDCTGSSDNPSQSSKLQPPLSDRLPSFFKRKTKINTDTVNLPSFC